MKKFKQRPRKSPLAKTSNKTSRSNDQGVSEYSGRNRWLMRLMAATLVPLFLLGLLEVGLRVAGCGYSTSYWRPSEIDGQDYLVPNHKFTYRFFPPALARAPLPTRILAEKPPHVFRIFLFGESAAYGDPEPAYGAGRHLEVLLRERYPGTDFEVVCTAMTAINSHAILPIARECARLDGDLWIIYMGNNEMVGAYGAGTVFSSKAPPLGVVRAILALKTTRIGQLLDSLIRGMQSDGSAPETWAGIDMFSKNQLRYDDPGRLTAYENFRGNLEDMLRIGQQADVPILLTTVASNLRDCAPFASLHRHKLDAAQLAEWETLCGQGKALEAAGSYPAALNFYSNAAAIDADFAELQFRIGACQLALTNPVQAKAAFERARDHDGLAVRADTRINAIIKDAAYGGTGGRVVLVDAAEILAGNSPEGIPGRELFYEHVHFTLPGNYQLARLLAEEVAAMLPSQITAAGRSEWVNADVCERQLAATLWDQHRVWNLILARSLQPPATAQANHRENILHYKDQKKFVISKIDDKTPQQDRELYEQALARAPDDNQLHARYAQYLEAMGFRSEAISEYQRICELLPDLEWPYCTLGVLLGRAQRYREAADSFERALEIRSDFTEARKALEQMQSRYPAAAGTGR